MADGESMWISPPREKARRRQEGAPHYSTATLYSAKSLAAAAVGRLALLVGSRRRVIALGCFYCRFSAGDNSVLLACLTDKITPIRFKAQGWGRRAWKRYKPWASYCMYPKAHRRDSSSG